MHAELMRAGMLRTGMLLAFAAAMLATPAVAAATPQATPTTVAVTITDTQVRILQEPVRIGLIIFKVANKSKKARDFRIAGKKTAQIAPGRSATLTLNATRSGLLMYASTGSGRTRQSGVLTFIDPCTTPTASTVSVQMAQDHGAITISQTAVPCGTVTFIVTNTGTMPDSLHVFAELSTDKGTTPELNPGQTASLTIRFTLKGTVHYESGDYPPAEPEYGGDYGEEGRLTLV